LYKLPLRIKIYSGFFVICFFWGSSWAAVKLGLESVPIFLSLGIRFAIASIILGLFIIVFRLKIPNNGKFWKLVFFLCVTSFAIPLVLIYRAQVQVNSGLASVLFATFPLWVVILSHFFLPDEKITLQRIIGIAFGFIGVVIIFNDGFSEMSNTTILGMVAIIFSAFIQASGLIAVRRFGNEMHPVWLIFWPVLLSSIIMLVVSIATEDYSASIFDSKAIASIIYLALFCTVMAFVINFWLIKHVEAVILSLSAFITPVIAVFIGVNIMGEAFTSTIYLGSAIVLIGIAVANIGDIVNTYRRKNGNI
jgi:drug/metabolite transporter (DMT)-like permease